MRGVREKCVDGEVEVEVKERKKMMRRRKNGMMRGMKVDVV